MKLTIGTKLLSTFLFVAVFVAFAGIVSFYYMNKVNTSYSDLIEQQVSIVTTTRDIEVFALQQTNDLRGYLLTDDASFLSGLQTANNKLNSRISETDPLLTEFESRQLMNELKQLNLRFQQRYERMLSSYKKDHDKAAALSLFKTEVLPLGLQLGPLAALISERQQQLLHNGVKRNTQNVNWANDAIRIMSLFAFILTLIIGWMISRHITRNLARITRFISSITPGLATTGLPRIEVHTSDEVGAIAHSFNDMASALDHYAAQERDKTWLETNIAKLVTMYQGIHDLEMLAQRFITAITPMTGASYGVFYIRQNNGGSQAVHKLAAYAYNERSIGEASFQFGIGLVGQAAADNQTILLTDIPASYMTITSGTGMTSPGSIIIIPVEFDGQVVAVIELASLTSFSPIQQALLHEVLDRLGITINSIAGRMQIEKLLHESQTLTEELLRQSEELQLQQEALKGTNEKLEEQNFNLEQKTKELEATKLELEEKAEQLALSSQYKSAFLANMSHELRTPLNSLLILSDILASNTEGNLTPNQKKYASTIYHSGNDLLRLINDVLDLSKVESGTIQIHYDEVKLRSICEYAEQQFIPVARQKGLMFTTELDDSLPPMLYTDEQRLLQMLRNLLSNAFKFTSHGHVTLRIHLADSLMLSHLREAENTILDESAIAFSIIDTGIGIPRDKHNLIFQAFQQADGTTSRKYGGTGLGLSISKNMAKLLNGCILLDSVEGVGSTFTLLLPGKDSLPRLDAPLLMEEAAAAVDPIETETESQEEASSSCSAADLKPIDPMFTGTTALIVDDDMRNIFAITTALEGKGMTVLFAENGVEGLRTLQQHTAAIDLILMDIMLPEMDGYEAIRKIRLMPAYQSLPIIALTAKAMKDDRDKCIEAGASDYISKPVHVDQLCSVIQVWLNK
ncbi:two-component system chemotaxis sensor kinase CheA [Paenibacillus cellulosilyticus]|uniref:Circadian input-output histidine kinase CikA n=1 Tax=Paenibacillus cellulosilyticus TaxID=375489 RepID=A0A2V2YGR5_9BACL|nr:response regulator [Paenibacillus cellulosilyticus]PWV92073.1 two-component system chemotaxis sensor kinase CheA [Paenibacillus cellulosilyticus]QKS44185.1 response regulator [Paenibacillus cellulosilyticus]